MPSADERLLFHLTGARTGALTPAEGLRPALFARVSELERLRYDFPLVLLRPDADGPRVTALSGLIDTLLAEAAPKGIAGERMRRTVLRLEGRVRAMVAGGARGTLSRLWNAAADDLATRGGAPVADDLGRARAALASDGPVVECDAATAAVLVTHLWRAMEERKARAMRERIDALAIRLSDLVRADHLRSRSGRSPDALRASIGAAHRDVFDFDRLAALLAAPSGASALSDARRARIDRTLAVLRRQRFFDGVLPFVFAFESVDDALAAYQGRIDAMVELVRAIAVAELELSGSYVEGRHDEYFARFDARALDPDDLALFPTYLVRLAAGPGDAVARARIMEGLTSGAPLKIVFATDDAFGLGAQLATTAMGLGDAFVLQSSAAQLLRVSDRIEAAIAYRGAALVAAYSPPRERATTPAYLVAAAATESHAFPTFSYDPAAGTDWRHRFSLHDDAPLDRVWPEHVLAYADGGMRRASERVAFTLADLALCDERYGADLSRVSRERWDERLVPIARWLDAPRGDGIPFVYAIDDAAGLHKVIVDEPLVQLVRRSAEAWLRLRELDDLKREPVAAAAAAPAASTEAAPVTNAETATATDAVGLAAPASSEPYIETPRCTTCNECVNLNPRMFAYNENRQAFIKDPLAGSYRELVEAAENCQVAIIHPGRPRDPNEPGLEELEHRAEAFA